MSQHTQIVIIGGGVIGLTTAWYLAGEGVRVILVEQGEIGKQASWAGAGILPAVERTQAQTPLEQLRTHSIGLYPELSAQLRQLTGVDNGYVVCGGIELPEEGRGAEALPSEEWHAPGTPFERCNRAGLERLVPALSPEIRQGVYLPRMAQVRNPWHLRALEAGCRARGVQLHPNWPVERFLGQGSSILAVEGPQGRLRADRFLLAAGAWSAKLAQLVGWALPIRPVRGQMVLFRTEASGVRPLLLQGKRYLVPRTDGRILAGSTEEEVGFDTRTTEQALQELRRFALTLMPELERAEVEASWAGLRPGSPQGIPYLGRVPGWDNLYLAAGHFRAGLLLSPGTGWVMAQLLRDCPTTIPLDEFRPDRAGIPAGTEER